MYVLPSSISFPKVDYYITRKHCDIILFEVSQLILNERYHCYHVFFPRTNECINIAGKMLPTKEFH